MLNRSKSCLRQILSWQILSWPWFKHLNLHFQEHVSMGATSIFSIPVEESPETWFGGRIQAIRCFIQRSAAIAFVPLSFVRVSWNGLKAEMPDNEKLERYAAYFDETWFDGHFRPRMWNYYRHCGPRTNNQLEGWHNRMKRISRRHTLTSMRCWSYFSSLVSRPHPAHVRRRGLVSQVGMLGLAPETRSGQ